MRYHKISADGARLPIEATEFVAIEDTQTGLMWSLTLAREQTQAKAAKVAKACKVAGHADWSLPSIQQLETLRDLSRHGPATPEIFAADTRNDWYWSSSAYAGNPDVYAWIVYFYYGGVYWYDRHLHACVRAVRSVASPVAGQ